MMMMPFAHTPKLPPDPRSDVSETRRLHERVRRYWQSVKENRLFPMKEEIDPDMIEEAWDYCFIVDMRNAKLKNGFRYEYMGPAIAAAYGANMQSLADCNTATLPHVASMLRHLSEVAESGEPAMDESEFHNSKGENVRYRCCLLPLGREQVEYVLGCMRWKVY